MGWFRKLRATLRPDGLDDSLDDELSFHLEQRTEEFIAQGMPPGEARRQARLLFGNRTALQESTRERNVLVWLETALQDLRYALRGMRRRPGFSSAAILSLALGIGANTALFSLIDALLLKMTPIAEPREIVRLQEGSSSGFTNAAFERMQAESRTLAGVTGIMRSLGEAYITEGGESRTAFVEVASASYFDVLGVSARRGRVFHHPEGKSPDGAIAVISDAYWRRHYGASSSAIGAHFEYANKDFTVAGITAPAFHGMFLDFPTDIWVPLEQLTGSNPAFWSRARAVLVFGRLKAGVNGLQVAAEMSSLLRAKIAVTAGGTGYSALRAKFWQPLTVVEVVAGLVLLIACANLASLMLAGAAARQSELAIRQAIGAGRWRLVRQWLSESLVVSLSGGAAALLVAAWMSHAVLRFLPPSAAPALGALQFRLDLRVLGFTAALAIFTSLLFGLAPALRATRSAPGRGLRSASRSWSSRALLICQVALCTVLVTGAGLFLRSLANLRSRASGFTIDHVLVATTLPIRGVSDEVMARREEELLHRAASIPGVRAAASSDIGLLSGFGVVFGVDPSGAVPSPQSPVAYRLLISPQFFATMGTPLLAGRDLSDADRSSAAHVAVVNETFVRQFFPTGDPLGRHFRTVEETPYADLEIVGVVKDTRIANLREEAAPTYYQPYRGRSRETITLALRGSGDVQRWAPVLERMAREIDPRWRLRDVVPFEEIEDRSLVVERLVALTSSAFGGLAVLVAAIGLYGVLALAVTRRTKEIGLRIALGASRGGVHWMVVREALVLVAGGIAIGLPGALAASRYVAAMLYGLKPADAGNVVAVVVSMTLVAVAAALVPAVRAARVDPMVALRCD
jgi:predicted permease